MSDSPLHDATSVDPRSPDTNVADSDVTDSDVADGDVAATNPAGAEVNGAEEKPGAADASAEEAANTAPVDLPPPKPATWTVREPDHAWCPPELATALARVLTADTVSELVARPAVGAAMHVANRQWHVTGATRRGRRHAHTGVFSEDAMFVHLSETRGVLVVADGAGSAKWSRLGSAVTVEVVGAAVRDASALSDALLVDAVEQAVESVKGLAADIACEPRALRTTVLVAAWEASPTGTKVYTTQVGDGALVLAHADGTITRPAPGDVGDWSGEVHCFLPDDETVARAREAALSMEVPDLAAVLLVSDGVDDAFYPFPKHAPGILGQLIHGTSAPLAPLSTQAEAPALLASDTPGATLLEWLAFEKRGENDDRTLAVALHRSTSPGIAPWAPSASD